MNYKVIKEFNNITVDSIIEYDEQYELWCYLDSSALCEGFTLLDNEFNPDNYKEYLICE